MYGDSQVSMRQVPWGVKGFSSDFSSPQEIDERVQESRCVVPHPLADFSLRLYNIWLKNDLLSVMLCPAFCRRSD